MSILDGYTADLIKQKQLDESYVTYAGTSETINPPKHTDGLRGWICPVCGRGLSPYTSVCPCKMGLGWEVTC